LRLPKGSRSVSAIGFSYDSKFIAAADMSNNHNIYLIDASNGKIIHSEVGGADKIFHLSWSLKSYSFTIVGPKLVGVW
jgi:hypothetical protein